MIKPLSVLVVGLFFLFSCNNNEAQLEKLQSENEKLQKKIKNQENDQLLTKETVNSPAYVRQIFEQNGEHLARVDLVQFKNGGVANENEKLRLFKIQNAEQKNFLESTKGSVVNLSVTNGVIQAVANSTIQNPAQKKSCRYTKESSSSDCYIKRYYECGGDFYIDVDYIVMKENEDGRGGYVVNNNPKIRTFKVQSHATISGVSEGPIDAQSFIRNEMNHEEVIYVKVRKGVIVRMSSWRHVS